MNEVLEVMAQVADLPPAQYRTVMGTLRFKLAERDGDLFDAYCKTLDSLSPGDAQTIRRAVSVGGGQ